MWHTKVVKKLNLTYLDKWQNEDGPQSFLSAMPKSNKQERNKNFNN